MPNRFTGENSDQSFENAKFAVEMCLRSQSKTTWLQALRLIHPSTHLQPTGIHPQMTRNRFQSPSFSQSSVLGAPLTATLPLPPGPRKRPRLNLILATAFAPYPVNPNAIDSQSDGSMYTDMDTVTSDPQTDPQIQTAMSTYNRLDESLTASRWIYVSY